MPALSVTFASGDLSLEGMLHLPTGAGPFPAVAVCHPHPRYGGDMHNNVVSAAVSGLTARGVAALRFNFRGVGRSDGDHGGSGEEADDVRAALAYLASRPEVDSARVGLAGYSFGAGMALRVAATGQPKLTGLVLVSLPLMMAGDAAATLAQVPCPVLLVSGDQDHICPLEELEAAAEEAGAHVRVQPVEETDHFWWGRDAVLAGAIGDCFAP